MPRCFPRLVGNDFRHSVLCRWRCVLPARRRTTPGGIEPAAVRRDSVSLPLLLLLLVSETHSSEFRRWAALSAAVTLLLLIRMSAARIRRRRDELRTSSSAWAASLRVGRHGDRDH